MTLRSLRGGATLIELIMGLMVACTVVVLALSHIARHQRAYDGIVAALDLRARLRDAGDIVATDLRGSSPIGDTILVALDTAIEFYSQVGTSTLCTVTPLNRLILPPDTLPSGRVLSSWLSTPDSADFALVYADSSAAATRGWQRARIMSVTSVATASVCPVTAGLLSPGDAAASNRSYEVSLSSAPPFLAHRGAPVRIVRRVRYSIYKGGDGKWYLGYRRCAPACAAIQPVSGPYQSNSGPPLKFRYFDRTGASLTGHGPSIDVARVEIVSHATFMRPIRLPGLPTATAVDSSVVVVAFRNRL